MSIEPTGAVGIRNIVGGGSANHGEYTYFDIQFDDMHVERFAAPTILMGRLILNLKAYATMADGDRAKTKGGQLAKASPHFVTTIANSAHTDDGAVVAVNFATTEGVPIELAMRPQQALETIAALERELRHIGHTTDKTGLN